MPLNAALYEPMNKHPLKNIFYRQIRKQKLFEACITKNIVMLASLSLVIFILLLWGIDIIFKSSPHPYVKLATVVIGYGIPIVNFIYDYKTIKIRHKLHRHKRVLRRSNRHS